MAVPVVSDFNGGTVPTTTINSWLTAIRFLLPISATKPSDQTVNNSATLVNDTALSVPVAPNAVYRFEMEVRYSTNATANLKFAWTFPAGLTMRYDLIGFASGTAVLDIFGLDQTSPAGVSGNRNTARMAGTITVSITGGPLQFQWAQNTANVSNTTVQAGSYLVLNQIG